LAGAQALTLPASVTALTIGNSNANGLAQFMSPTYTAALSGGTGMSLTKVGTNVQTLGALSYTGATNINAGTLVINGALSSTAAVTVGQVGGLGTTATLGGAGSIAGPVTVVGAGTGNTLGKLAPGANLTTGAAILTINNTISVGLGASMDYRLSQSTNQALANNDLVIGGGAVSFGGPISLNINAYAGTLASGSYLLMYSSGTINGGVSPTGWLISQTGDTGHAYSVSVPDSNHMYLTVVAANNSTWSGSTDGVWNTGVTNWSSGPVPGATAGTTSNDGAIFGGSVTNKIITVDGGRVIRDVTFTSSAGGGYTIGAGAVNSNSLILS